MIVTAVRFREVLSEKEELERVTVDTSVLGERRRAPWLCEQLDWRKVKRGDELFYDPRTREGWLIVNLEGQPAEL